MSVVECIDMTKVYSRKKVLNNISFAIEENKITGLIGRNGAGKTTLLKIISGFIQETSGDIHVFSKKPFNNLFVSANTIFIDNQMNLPSSLQLIEILEEAKRFYGNWDHELALRLFDYFSFHSNDYHSHLSKGMKSIFNMILGLCSRCALTIYDEPTTGMDAAIRKDFYRALLKDYIAHPRTIIISSHHLDEIEDLLEEILLLKDGKAFLHLPISELKEWAIELKGKSSVIEQWTAGKEIIHTKTITPDNIIITVKNDFTLADLQNMQRSGIHTSPVTPNDLCVYLTNPQKGGIDDVFN